jgi:hypothetical protein
VARPTKLIGEFLLDLARDKKGLASYAEDPEAYMAAYGLNKTQQKILLGNNLEKIRETVREEYRKADIFIFPMFVGVKRKP